MKTRLLIAALFFACSLSAQDFSAYQLIAHYPFSSNGNDITTNYGDATMENVNYAQSGAYSNGMYGTGASLIKTPNISGLNTNDFAINLKFNPDEVPGSPILMVGNSWRWLHCFTEYNFTTSSNNLSVTVSKTNGFDQNIQTTQAIQPNTWYEMTVMYSAQNNTLTIYVDNQQVGQETLDASIAHNNDFDFVNQDGGLGQTFKGHLRDLKIYNKSASASIDENLTNITLNSYPNPAADQLTFHSILPSDTPYFIYSLEGQLMESGKTTSPTTTVDLNDFKNGIYFLTLEKGDRLITEKVLVQK